MKRMLLVVLSLVTCGLTAATPAADELPVAEKVFPQLDPILKRAVQQSPRMITQNLNVEMAEESRIQARAGMLPYFAGYGRFLQSRDDRADQPEVLKTDKVYYDVSVTQPLFHWGERKNNAEIGKITALIAKGSYREAYRALASEIRSTYLGLVFKKIALARCNFNRTYTKQLLAINEDKLAKKIISDLQISAYRLQAEQAELACDRAAFDLDTGKRTFARLTGGELLTDDQIPDSVPVLPYPSGTIDQLLAAYLAVPEPTNIEAVNMRYQLDVDKLNLANAKKRLLPKFNLTAGISQDEQSYTVNTAQKYQLQSLYAGVGVSWTLFDGLASQSAVRSSLAHSRQTENEYRQLVDRLAQQAQTSVKYINFAARSMSISDRSLQGAEGMLKTRQEEFKRGDMAEADVSVAELGVYDARLYALTNRLDYLARVGDFLGQVVEDPVIHNLDTQ